MQVKALVAAAGSNFNKQIKDLRLQVKGLKETPMSLSEKPGRARLGLDSQHNINVLLLCSIYMGNILMLYNMILM